MADVQNLLKNILSAVYGKDVRQSIHDAIQQCYYDGKAGGNDLEARDRAAAAEARMDTFTSLPSGSTSGNAELADIRIGLDGKKYSSAGTAVREQIRNTRSIEVSEIEPTRENTVLWINPTERNTIYVNGIRDGKESVVAFEYTAIRVKNEAGVWESIPAIGGESVYDLAVRHGYIGTEEEFAEELLSSGWADAVLQLEEKKADRTELKSEIAATEKLIDEVPNQIQPVGTIVTSVRKDLGDKWLLCNGSCFNAEEYPELYEAMPFDYGAELVDIGEDVLADVLADGGILVTATYGGGWYVIVGFTNGTGNTQDFGTGTVFVCYSQDLVTWNKKTIYTYKTFNQYDYFLPADLTIRYVNDRFMLTFTTEYVNNSTASYYDVSVIHAINPNEEWTTVTVCNGGFGLHIGGIAYGNGYYVIPLWSSNGLQVWHSQNLISWTKKSIHNAQCFAPVDIQFLNGYFVVPHTCAGSNAHRVTYFANPDLTISESIVTSTVKSIIYENNQYVALCEAGLYVSSDLNTWTQGPGVPTNITTNASYMYGFCYINGDYVCAVCDTSTDTVHFLYTNDLNGSFTATPSVLTDDNLRDAVLFEDAFFVFGVNSGWVVNFRNRLPNISYDKAYAYIKAAE